jgi:hypothetical protein
VELETLLLQVHHKEIMEVLLQVLPQTHLVVVEVELEVQVLMHQVQVVVMVEQDLQMILQEVV